MRNPSASLQTNDIADPATRDNFVKLQSILQGDLVRQTGEFVVQVASIWSPDQSWTIAFERIGYQIIWQPTFDLISSSKPDAVNPYFHAPLPKILWPRAKQRIPVHVVNNATESAGATVVIDTAGNVAFWPSPGSAWVAGRQAILYANAVSYLGF